MLLYAIIFISGGAILALELLASRIMTPYFGVSLHIWTGILSITLIALALGYWWGGRLASAGRADGAGTARLLRLYATMPAIAAIAVMAACLVYPYAFAPLARASLLGGAFAACMVLLFVPLVAASAMNPLLVAILLEREKTGRTGDAGAGKVFFVSTIGSVAGVIVTAFGVERAGFTRLMHSTDPDPPVAVSEGVSHVQLGREGRRVARQPESRM